MARTLAALCALLACSALPARAQAVLHALQSPAAEPGSYFGYAVATVPDADGDGVTDLITGAYGERVGSVGDAGRAYLFSGATGALLHTVEYPDDISGSYYGEEVAGLPDVDGDGRGDFAVGGAVGIAYVYSGATGNLLYEIWPQPGAVIGFARSLAGVADLNGDGRGEILLGAYRADFGAAQTGRAFVFSGADGKLLFPLNPPAVNANGHFGRSVAVVPDVDGDDLPDLLVGAYNERVGSLTPGQAHLYSGATGAHLRAVTSPNPKGTGDFALYVAGVADVDGDGRGDLLVGAPYEDESEIRDGRAYLFSGATGTLLRTFISPNPVRGGNFGAAVAGAGDLDGDGTPDLLVSAPAENAGENEAGRVYVFSGATGALLASLESPNPRTSTNGNGFGHDVAAVPDLNGDGRDDLLVGAPVELAEPGGVVGGGRMYVFSGAVATAIETPADFASLAVTLHPNPARDRVTFRIAQAQSGQARLALYDLLGREVAIVVDGDLPPGRTEAAFDGSRLPPGVYVARLVTREGATSTLVTLVR